MAAETADGSAGGGGGRYAGLTHSVFGSGKPFMERSVTPGKKVRGAWRVDCRACSTSTSSSSYTLNCRAKARTPRRPMLQPAALGPRVAPPKRHPPRVPVGRGVGHLLRGVVASLGRGGGAASLDVAVDRMPTQTPTPTPPAALLLGVAVVVAPLLLRPQAAVLRACLTRALAPVLAALPRLRVAVASRHAPVAGESAAVLRPVLGHDKRSPTHHSPPRRASCRTH